MELLFFSSVYYSVILQLHLHSFDQLSAFRSMKQLHVLLADRTTGHAFGILCHLSVCRL